MRNVTIRRTRDTNEVRQVTDIAKLMPIVERRRHQYIQVGQTVRPVSVAGTSDIYTPHHAQRTADTLVVCLLCPRPIGGGLKQ